MLGKFLKSFTAAPFHRAIVLTAFVGLASPCNAQVIHTWVAGYGSDQSTCIITAPCATFAHAISNTAAGGEISVLSPGSFGPVTITKAITIRADYVEAAVNWSSGAGIVVSAGDNDKVVLEGLDLDTMGVLGAGYGVEVNSGATVYILRCAIRNVQGFGIYVNTPTSGTRVFVRDSFITNDSVGVDASSFAANSVAITNTVIDGSRNVAVTAGGGNSIALVRSIVSGSSTAISNDGSVISIGPSNIITGNGAPTATTPYR